MKPTVMIINIRTTSKSSPLRRSAVSAGLFAGLRPGNNQDGAEHTPLWNTRGENRRIAKESKDLVQLNVIVAAAA